MPRSLSSARGSQRAKPVKHVRKSLPRGCAQRGAEALAPIGALLADIDPDVLSFYVPARQSRGDREASKRAGTSCANARSSVGTSEPVPRARRGGPSGSWWR